MKLDIKTGSTYSNGKGRRRKVLELGDFPLLKRQADHDCVKYEYMMADGTRRAGHCTKSSFQKWAKSEVGS